MEGVSVYQMPKKRIRYITNDVKLFETPRTREYLFIYLFFTKGNENLIA